MRVFACTILIAIFFLISILHFYWVFGGKWGLSGAIPDVMKERPTANPSSIGFRIATIIVAFGLLGMACVFVVRGGYFNSSIPSQYFIYATYAIITIFSLRAIGEFKYVGFFKKIKEGEFASKDSKIYSPLCLLIAVLGVVSLL